MSIWPGDVPVLVHVTTGASSATSDSSASVTCHVRHCLPSPNDDNKQKRQQPNESGVCGP